MTKQTPLFRSLLIAGLFSVVAGGAVRAADVSAELTSSQTSVGVPVQLKIEVQGSTNAYPPQEITVDGLQIQPTGQSRRVEFNNFKMTASVVYNYTILPEREGTFKIPGLEVNIDGKKIKTPPLQLAVKAAIARAIPAPLQPAPPVAGSAQPRNAPAGADAKLAFAEMIVPKQSVYVGEMVPVELRFFFNQRVPFRIQDRPNFGGEGFTVEKLSDPLRSEQLIGETTYHVFTFQTAITAVKSGELEIPAVSLEAIASVPSQGPAGFENMFSQFFGNSGMPGFTDDRQITLTSDPQTLTVKPLPKQGRPDDFSGAIGDFTMTAAATPEKVESGNPITLKLTVAGRGNFGAMGAPSLTGIDGWRLYPPAEKFEAADPVGYGGTKVFENMLVAERVQTETPGSRFVYFDPSKGEYVTLKTEPIAVEAAASNQPAPTVAAAASATPDQATEPDTAADSRSGVLARTTPRSFESFVSSPVFLVANGAAAVVVLGLLAVGVYRRSQSGEAARKSALRKHEAHLLQKLDRSTLDDGEFLTVAREVLACQAQLAGLDDAEALVAATRATNSGAGEGLNLLLARSDETKFSGGVATKLDPEDRAAITRALREVVR